MDYYAKKITCNECRRELTINNFYTHYGTSQTCKDKSKKYLKVNHICKNCRARLRRERISEIKEQIEERKIQEEIQLTKKEIETPQWIIRNLKWYGNCYVKKLRKINMEKLPEQVGFEIKVEPAGDINGYILERK